MCNYYPENPLTNLPKTPKGRNVTQVPVSTYKTIYYKLENANIYFHKKYSYIKKGPMRRLFNCVIQTCLLVGVIPGREIRMFNAEKK